MLSQQMALLPAEELGPHDLQTQLQGIAWSYSRRLTLERCSRQYYYEYYGAGSRDAMAEPQKALLRSAKELSNRHLRVGELVHEAIARYFRSARAGATWTADRLVWGARSSFRADRAYSRALALGNSPTVNADFPPVALSEYLLGEPSVEALMDQAEKRLELALRSFDSQVAFAALRRAGLQEGALIEASFHLAGLPCRVQGKADLAWATTDGATVVDWKLGETENRGEDSLQLGVYGLWAIQQFDCGPESLRLIKAFLGSGDTREYRVDAPMLQAVRLRITQDAERMLTMQEYAHDANSAAFSPVVQRKVCGQCSYRQICPEGLELLAS